MKVIEVIKSYRNGKVILTEVVDSDDNDVLYDVAENLCEEDGSGHIHGYTFIWSVVSDPVRINSIISDKLDSLDAKIGNLQTYRTKIAETFSGKTVKEILETPFPSLDEYFEKIRLANDIVEKQLTRFYDRYGNVKMFGEIVEKIEAKYNSDKYRDHWYNQGIEPPEPLYWFLLEYAKSYGREATADEIRLYANMFTAQLYYVHGYYFNQMNGQGSVVHIIKENKELTKNYYDRNGND